MHSSLAIASGAFLASLFGLCSLYLFRYRLYPTKRSPLYLGIDCSTQALTILITDSHYQVVCKTSVNFQNDLPGYGTCAGALISEGGVVLSPTIMFIHALDNALDHICGLVDMSRITAISGCAQQHGTVYWNKKSATDLCHLDPKLTLREQLKDSFSVQNSPIWMDSSTSSQCRRIEALVGSAEVVADITGSGACERFAASQIAKQIEIAPDAYQETQRISLISSMFTSLFIGKYATIDESDAAGMNLMDMGTRCWSNRLLDAVAGERSSHLLELLGPDPVPSDSIAGPIAAYFIQRYNFSGLCQIIPFTGDNPSTVSWVGLTEPGDVAVSLGTSDTVFALVPRDEYHPSPITGHIFPNPINKFTNMVLLCFQNGSLARQDVCDKLADQSWAKFSQLFSQENPGNDGIIGFFYPFPEIVPRIRKPGVFAFDFRGSLVDLDDYPPSVQVRAIIESQCLSMLHHSLSLGVRPQRIFVCGGASVNTDIVTTLSNVFNTPVYSLPIGDMAASFGAVYRAQLAVNSDRIYPRRQHNAPILRAVPDPNLADLYHTMLARFTDLQSQVIEACS